MLRNRDNNSNIGRDNNVESILDQFMEDDDDEINNSMLHGNNLNIQHSLFGNNISAILNDARPNNDFDNFSNDNYNNENGNNNYGGNNRRFRNFSRGRNRGGNRGGYRGGNRGGNRGGYRGGNRGGYRGNNRRNDDFNERDFNDRGNNRRNNRDDRDNYRRNDDFNEREYNNRGNNRRNNRDDRDDYRRNDRNDNSGFSNNGNKNQNNRRRTPFISFEKMKELYNEELNNIYEYFMSYPNYESLINGTEFKILMISMFMSIMRRMSEDNSEASYQIISTLIDNTAFFSNEVKTYLLKKEVIDKHYLIFVNDYLTFYKRIMERFNDKFKKLSLWTLGNLIEELQKKCENAGDDLLNDDDFVEYNDIAWKIIDNYNEIIKKQQDDENLSKKFQNLKIVIKQNDELDKFPIDYQQQEIEISKEELLNDYEKNIAKHLIKGSYKSYDRYFNTLFYLTYEDCYRALKYTIYSLYNENEQIDPRYVEKKYKDIYYYFNASIPGIEATNEGIILTVEFQAPKIIKFTKRMIYGSLLVLTDENWNDFLLITVYHNPYIINRNSNNNKQMGKLPKPPKYRILAKLFNTNKKSFKFIINSRKQNLHIFESKAYFESYVHILKRLKQINTKDLPFKNEIIDANFKDIKAYYLRKNKYIQYYEDSFELNSLPLSLKNILDKSQLEAIQLSLNNEIALIQGPPGTGKTYVGGILTSILLQNISSPILIVCYTNHALDQFIEHIMEYTNKIIRIGGRCNNEKVKQFGIKNFRTGRKSYFKINKAIEDLCYELRDYLDLLDERRGIHFNDAIQYFPNLINKIINDFYELINEERRNNFYEKKLFKCWSNKIKITEIYILFNIDERDYDLFDRFCKFNNNYVYLRNNHERENLENLANQNDANNNNNNDNENNNQNIDDSEDDEDVIEENLERLEYEYNNIMDNDFRMNYDDFIEEKIDLKNKLTQDEISNIIQNNNLWEIGPQIRNVIIDYMKDKILSKDNFFNFKKIEEYEQKLNQKYTMELMADSNIIKQNKIIAMTTTGCAKYSTILEQNNFEVVIIEEAAEVLEPHIVSLLTKNTKHLIMIGDHQQLRPKPYDYGLAKKFNFDVSLFERLINNKIPYATLKYQRRMKSMFADFVRLIYHDNYIDYEDVDNKEIIKGIEKDMFIITHNRPEEEDINLSSKKNKFEAEYLVKLCKYFILQGYDISKITILTFYVGQVLLIRSFCKKEGIDGIRVSSVDNYQGEENDIILLSLVRSNSNNKIGFLKNFNRVCVSFSRAKLGFFIIGNIDCLIKGENEYYSFKDNEKKNSDSRMKDIWKRIKELAVKKEIISDKLTLTCQKHKTKTIISNLTDFSKIPEGGCQKRCGERLPCGHTCELLCHPYSHKEIKCKKECTQILPCGHKCTKLCYQQCGNCLTEVTKTLPCGHSGIYECYLKEEMILCKSKCNRYKKCGHKCKSLCYEKCDDIPCHEEVEKKLLCGHSNKYECCIPLYQCRCKEPCKAALKCGHKCTGTCGKCLNGTLHIPCTNICDKGLICGHRCKQTCSQECLCKEPCPNTCFHGYCNLICCEKCIDCKEKCVLGCVHTQLCKKLCYEICNIKRCDKRCEKIMDCGHQCMGLCGQICPGICKICNPKDENFVIFFGNEDEDDALFYKTKCGHCIEVRDMDKYMDDDKSINMPVCPKCKSILMYEPRYQDVIKKRLIDVQKVKEILMNRNGSDEFLKKSKQIILKVRNEIQIGNIECLNKIYIGLMTLLEDCNKICTSFNADIVQAKLITTYNILTQLQIFVAIEYYQKKLMNKVKENKELSSTEKKYLWNYNVIKEYFMGYKTFNNFFFEDFQNKLKNLLCYIQIEENSQITSMLMFGGRNLVVRMDNNNFHCTNEELKEFHIISKFDAQKILQSLGTTWYRCPNGHYYVIGECGQPMQSSRCPECGLQIGGVGHVPQNGNVQVNDNEILNHLYGNNN